MLPLDAYARAEEGCRRCDTLVVVGSSLEVYPVADLPRMALARGARLLIVNRDPTPYDGAAHLVLRGSAGAILPDVVGALEGGDVRGERKRGKRKEEGRAPGGSRYLRRVGVLLVAGGGPGAEGRHPLRGAQRRRHPGGDRRPPRRLPAAARPHAPPAPAPDQLPRQRLGHEVPGRPVALRSLRGGEPPTPHPAGGVRGVRPVRGPDVGAPRHLLRGAHGDPHRGCRPLLSDAPAARGAGGPGPGDPRARPGNG